MRKVSITSTDNTISKILCIAIRVNIYQARDKIGIWRARNGPEMHFDWPGHLNVLFQLTCCIHQNIFASLIPIRILW